MSYIGNLPTTAAFPFDQFSGTGSQTAFTLSQAPASTTSIVVAVSGVVQNPNTYSISGSVLTFTGAPPSGTNNIGVLFLGLPAIVGVPSAGVVTPAMLSTGGPSWDTSSNLSVAGNLAFTGLGDRITGDFSNATLANRVMFQTSTVNGQTSIGVLPNGTSTSANINLFGGIDTANASIGQLVNTGGEASLRATITGTGAYLPMTFHTGGSERLRVDTSGNVGIGVSAPVYKLHARGTGDTTFAAESTSTGAGIFRAFGPDATYAAYNAIISSAVVGGQQWYVGGDGFQNTLVFKTGTTEKVRIDSSGNVGIGTSSPGQKLDVKGFTRSSAGTGTGAGGAGYAFHQFGTSTTATENWHIGTEGDGSFRFYNQGIGAGLERMRIDSSGNLLVGTASANSARITAINSAGGASISAAVPGTTGDHIYFRTSTNTLAGFISSPSATSTTYNSLSDYRLKENIQPMTGALLKVAGLNPVTYKWKVDGSEGQGFIAHELQAVVPDCVTGDKDAVNEDGSIKPQGIDTSFLVATLTAAIQEQQQMIETLQAKVAALENK